MSRFMKDVYLGCPDEAVEKVVQDYLFRNRFHETQWNGKSIWGADSICAPNYRLFDYSYQNGNLHIEAFLRHGKSGELDLNGWEAMGDRKAYLESIVFLLQEIVALTPENSALSVERILGEMDNKTLKNYRILWPIVIVIAMIFISLPYFF